MEQLNVVGLVGTATKAPEPYHNVYGRGNVYALPLDVTRDSGTVDRVLVLFQEDVVNGESYDELPWNEPGSMAALIKEGSRVEVTGALQTYKDVTGVLQMYKDTRTGRTQLFVWAKYIAAAQPDEPESNAVYINGELARVPVYRVTPFGRRITDVMLRVPSEFSPGFYSLVPCITWGEVADWAKNLEENRAVYIEGRLQSRGYTKHYDDGSEEKLVTWEVSVCKMFTESAEVEGEKENGN